jgi:nitrite reductase/ring-hydroxylating ferredoxin subunit
MRMPLNLHRNYFILLFLVVIAGLSPQCKKKSKNVIIPYVPVNVIIFVSDPQFNQLNAVGGWAYINAGSRGIIVYRRSNEDFVALDRHCTFQPENTCGRVSVNNTQIVAVDTCCGSEFVLTDGSAVKGPAVAPLLSYGTTFDGLRLQIFN